KAFGLAALRIGYGVMHPDLADAALRLRIPFSLGLPALRAAGGAPARPARTLRIRSTLGLRALRAPAAALADPADIEARRGFISSERERVFTALTRLEGVDPYPSEGHFLLINGAASRRTNDEIIRIAHGEKILLRAMGSHRLRGAHVRVTIGLAEQNDRFLDLFGRLFAPEIGRG